VQAGDLLTWLFYLLRPFLGTFFKTVWMVWRPKGKNRIPKGKVIIASNHVSKADPAVMMSFFWKPVKFLAKEELFQNPLSGFFYRSIGQIPVKRGGGDIEAFESALKELEKRRRVGIFPEGTRGNGRKMLRAHTGAVRLALLSGAPIVPMGISGSEKAFPKGSIIPRITRIRVRFGDPWYVPKPPDSEEYSYEELKQLAEHLLHDRIEPLLDHSS
jgi:1-acyl-sn-glycerol-3-phosphate acyltransferase